MADKVQWQVAVDVLDSSVKTENYRRGTRRIVVLITEDLEAAADCKDAIVNILKNLGVLHKVTVGLGRVRNDGSKEDGGAKNTAPDPRNPIHKK
jgi:hypothetical protein